MKLSQILLFSLFSILAPTAYSQNNSEVASSPADDSSFYAIYPDLASHDDIVRAAVMSLAAEGFKSQIKSSVMDAVATRARINLQRSKGSATAQINTVDLQQQVDRARKEAVRLFPEVDVNGSALSDRVLQERTKLEKIYPYYFTDPNWPLMLTSGCIAAMIFDAQEKTVQAQAVQPQMSIDEMNQTVDLLKKLQELKNSGYRSR